MTRVKCSVGACSYNKTGSCYIEKVNIGGKTTTDGDKTCCGSFLDQNSYSNLADYTSFRGSAEEVDCNVQSCKNNQNCKCALNEIEVSGSGSACRYTDTVCASFEKRGEGILPL